MKGQNVHRGALAAVDVSYADHGRYFLADRNNKAIDVVDTSTNKLIEQIPGGFFGIGASLDTSGPNGLVGLPGTTTLYVGDVNSVKIIDTSSQALVKTIPLNTGGTRVDGGCFDSDDHLVAITSPAETPPYTTFINTDTQSIVGRLTFTGSSGLESCAYDPGSKSILINNDGTGRLRPGRGQSTHHTDSRPYERQRARETSVRWCRSDCLRQRLEPLFPTRTALDGQWHGGGFGLHSGNGHCGRVQPNDHH